MNRNPKVGIGEILRTVIVILLIITLFDPQRIEKRQSIRKSQIICLVDNSDSMQTEDIFLNNNSSITRTIWNNNFLKQSGITSLEKNASLLIKTFSSKAGKNMTDISSAIGDSFDTAENLKSILLLTDGDSNTGQSVLSVAGRSRELSVPIHSIITGSPLPLPDLSLDDAFAPSFVLQEERITIGWMAKNSFGTPKSTSLTLLANGEKIDEKVVSFDAGEVISGNFSWLPQSSGDIEFEIIINEVDGETYYHNNQRNFRTRVEEKIIKVLGASTCKP